MNVGLLNERITIQRNATVVDEIGNHTNDWAEYYSCACTVGGESYRTSETEVAAQTVDHSDISFTVRSCRLTDAVGTDKFRIIFYDKEYNIISIDHMNYKKKCIKFRCRKV